MRTIAAFFGDTHGNFKGGLLNPATQLPIVDQIGGEVDYYTPQLIPVQQRLWEYYTADVGDVARWAKKARLFVVHNGDLTHGDKYESRLVSTARGDQVIIAVANMEPWFRLRQLDWFRIVTGTNAHTLGLSTAPTLVYKQLQALYPSVSIRLLNHSRLCLDNVIIDYAHHGPSPGIREWTQGNQLRYYVRSLIVQDLTRGRRPPDVVVRAHYHTMTWITERVKVGNGKYHTCEAFILPSYCAMTEHSLQSSRSEAIISNGLVAIEIEDGRVTECRPIWRETDVRLQETIE